MTHLPTIPHLNKRSSSKPPSFFKKVHLFLASHHPIEAFLLAVAFVILAASLITAGLIYQRYHKISSLLTEADQHVQAEDFPTALADYQQITSYSHLGPIHLNFADNLPAKVSLAQKMSTSHHHFALGIEHFNDRNYPSAISEFSQVDSQDGSYALAQAKIKDSHDLENSEAYVLQAFDNFYQKALASYKASDYTSTLNLANQGLALVGEDYHFNQTKIADLQNKRSQARNYILEAQARDQAQKAAADAAAAGPTLRVPILMYHYIRTNPDPHDRVGASLSVAPGDFSQQMDYLSSHDYHAVDVLTVLKALKKETTLPSHPIVITFDDGYRDFYTTAFPILQAHSLHSEAYIVSGFVGGGNYMTWDMLAQLKSSGLVTIASHTVHHTYLSTASPTTVKTELKESKATLEHNLGLTITDFCYPYGAVSSAVAKDVQDAGYLDATTTAAGSAHTLGQAFTLTRIRVSGGESLNSFISNL